ncbi:MAG TPA: hypothetical protein VFF98_07165, partial [Novosphingobium sp.]|nr:hypothetical protein [Novosphingobium sp.]
FHQSMVDRTVMDWAGPLAFLTRRKIAMLDQICPGDRIEGHARVERVYRGEKGEGLVDFTVEITRPGTVCCRGWATLRLPERAG